MLTKRHGMISDFGSIRTQRVLLARRVCLVSTVTLLEAKGRDKNRREGGNECCRQSDIVGFGNARNGARVLCCLRRAHSKPGEHCYLARSVGAR